MANIVDHIRDMPQEQMRRLIEEAKKAIEAQDSFYRPQRVVTWEDNNFPPVEYDPFRMEYRTKGLPLKLTPAQSMANDLLAILIELLDFDWTQRDSVAKRDALVQRARALVATIEGSAP